MQRLTIQCEGEWSFDPDPDGEVVEADEAIAKLNRAKDLLRQCLPKLEIGAAVYPEVMAFLQSEK